jgi:hypothetical protein
VFEHESLVNQAFEAAAEGVDVGAGVAKSVVK